MASRYSRTFLSEDLSRITPTKTALLVWVTSKELSELEDNGEGVGNLHGAVSLLARLPLRGRRDNADSLFVEGLIHAAEDLDVGDAAVGFHCELEGYTALHAVFLGDFRID